jgi:KAP family P-loop domain
VNSRQKKIQDSWLPQLWGFGKREWFSLFLSSSLGVLAAELIHLLAQDHAFQNSIITHYKPWVSSDDSRYYLPYLAIFLFVMLLSFGPPLCTNVWRGLKSWGAGVTSGLVLLPFASALSISMLPSPPASHRFILAFCLAIAWFMASFRLYLRANVRAVRTVHESEFTVPPHVRSLAGSALEWSDDPIQTWPQDALGRAALVDSLSIKIMIAKTPVVALSGPFGSGKTSTLNLLREHLGTKAITVSFSTWLPGSQETLTSYLLADIANECKKQYVVPGLTQSTTRLAAALGQKVPFLSEYLKLRPAPTQKDDIANLKSALVRLPKRVVVLLDEIDRMEKEEIITLLKVIRGIATLPNVSFVCAGSLETIGKIVEKDEEYFEKFFPVIISVTEPDPAALRRAGADRLVDAFASCDWFVNNTEAEQFKKRIESVWDARIALFCKTLRAVGLLANDVSVAAAPLRREVDPLDLTLIEMLHRFEPLVYRLVARNSFALTGGESLVRGGAYHTDKEDEEARKTLIDKLKKASENDQEFDRVIGVINELFPVISTTERRSRRAQRASETSELEEADKRIRQPGIFPAYFRYELPDEIFSSVQLASLLQKLEHASTQEERYTIFSNTLQSMGKGSLKRDDFLRKLADSAKTVPLPVGKSLGESAAKAAANYTYDLMPQFGEAGHVLRMILLIALRLSKTDRLAFLQDCISEATDDTMSFRILTLLPAQKGDDNIGISVGELYESFAKRMRNRYGRNVDALNFDLSKSDSWALEYWGRDLRASGIPTDPEDRKIQNDFWLRFIGNSRTRLAKAFREFFLPMAAYSADPAPLVQNRISLEDLNRLYKELPDDPTLTDLDRKSLDTLRRFLDGEFKSGISPTSGIW